MAQKKSIAVSGVTSLALASTKVNIPWSTYDYMDHGIAFSDLSGITASVRIYPAIASGAQYTVDATTFTGDNKGKFYHYADYGSIGIVVVFDAPFTGTVHFGSVRSAVNWLT